MTTLAPRKSSFVSILAWFSLISGALGVLFGLLDITEPSFVSVSSLLGSIAALTTGWGLLHRQEWGRKAFIALLAYATVIGFVDAFLIPGQMAEAYSGAVSLGAPPLPPEEFQGVISRLQVLAYGVAVLFAAINLAIIVKLRSAPAREEFSATRNLAA
jgi:hypothetical protein